jgi:sialic acid synthase SpsE/endonuclease IV
MTKRFKLAQQSPFKTYVIAEIGINHNGDIKIAKKLINKAVQAGADAVKTQCRDLKSIYTQKIIKDPKKAEQGVQYLISELKKANLSYQEIAELYLYAGRLNIDFLATPFDLKSAKFLNQLGVEIFKIGSPDFTNLFLIEEIMKFHKPIILSTGMSQYKEVKQVVQVLKNAQAKFCLLHCNSTYPAFPQDLNLKMIPRMRKDFGVEIGYSSHEKGFTPTLAAVALGASIIERHITLDQKQRGPDHTSSLLPNEFRSMIDAIRELEVALGSSKKKLIQGEKNNRLALGKSLVYSKNLKKGEVLNRFFLKAKSPAKGIPALKYKEFLGKKLLISVKKDDYLKKSHIANNQGVPKLSISNLKNWGVIVRLNDLDEFLDIKPKVIEIHLTWRDLLGFKKGVPGIYNQQLIVHAPEYYKEDRLIDFTTKDAEITTYSLEMINKTLDLARQLAPSFKGTGDEGPKIVLHPGGHFQKPPKNYKTRQYRTLRENLKKLNLKGVQLLLENMPPFPWYFGGRWYNTIFLDSKEIASFSESTKLGICFDLSHAQLYCNLANKSLKKFAKEIKPYAKHLHISDAKGTAGEGLQIGEGEIDFKEILKIFKDKSLSFVPEIWQGHLNSGEGFYKALQLLDSLG